MTSRTSKISPMSDTGISTRTVSADPGLLSNEELLARNTGRRRRTLEELIAKEQLKRFVSTRERFSDLFKRAKKKVRWFIDHAQLKISVSHHRVLFATSDVFSLQFTISRVIEQYDDFMMAVTIFVLFGDDIRTLCFPPSSDSGFTFFVSLSFILFVLELLLHVWAKSDFSNGLFRVKGYAFSFFFWLDLLAVFSMVPDVAWLASALGLQDDLMGSLGK